MPKLELDSWALEVECRARSTLCLDYHYLTGMPSREVDCLLECAGNSRAASQPPIEGLLWDHGAVGTARWKGVPLREVLERAGSLDSATDALLEGADRGTENGMPAEAPYVVSIPLEKALDLDTILAYEMEIGQYSSRLIAPPTKSGGSSEQVAVMVSALTAGSFRYQWEAALLADE